MDKIDYSIITILQKHLRASNAFISREVGVSEGTVRRRLKIMQDMDMLGVAVHGDPAQLGFGTEALIGFQISPDKVDIVAQKLADIVSTRWVSITTGAYDVFAFVSLPSPEDLSRFLREALGGIEGVSHTETFVTLSVLKRDYGLSPDLLNSNYA